LDYVLLLTAGGFYKNAGKTRLFSCSLLGGFSLFGLTFKKLFPSEVSFIF